MNSTIENLKNEYAFSIVFKVTCKKPNENLQSQVYEILNSFLDQALEIIQNEQKFKHGNTNTDSFYSLQYSPSLVASENDIHYFCPSRNQSIPLSKISPEIEHVYQAEIFDEYFQLGKCLRYLIEYLSSQSQDILFQQTLQKLALYDSVQDVTLDNFHLTLLDKLKQKFQKDSKGEKVDLLKKFNKRILMQEKENRNIKFEAINQLYEICPKDNNQHDFFENTLRKILDSKLLQEQSNLVNLSLTQIHEGIIKDNFQDPILLPSELYYSKDPHIIQTRQKFREKVQNQIYNYLKFSQQEIQRSTFIQSNDKLGYKNLLQQFPLVTQILPNERVLKIHTQQKTYIVTQRGVVNSLRKPLLFSQNNSMSFLQKMQSLFKEKIINITQFETLLNEKLRSKDSKKYLEMTTTDVYIGTKVNQETINDIEINLGQEEQQSLTHAIIHLGEILSTFRWFRCYIFKQILGGFYGTFPHYKPIRKLPFRILDLIFNFCNEQYIYIGYLGFPPKIYVQFYDNKIIIQNQLQIQIEDIDLIFLGPFKSFYESLQLTINPSSKQERNQIQQELYRLYQNRQWEYLDAQSQKSLRDAQEINEFSQCYIIIVKESNNQFKPINVKVIFFNAYIKNDFLIQGVNNSLRQGVLNVLIKGIKIPLYAKALENSRYFLYQEHCQEIQPIWQRKLKILIIRLQVSPFTACEGKIYTHRLQKGSKFKIGKEQLQIDWT